MNDKQLLSQNGFDNQDDLDLDELEAKLNEDLNNQFEDLKELEDDAKKIGDTEALGESIQKVVWEQFQNQLGVKAGQDFIRKNGDMKLDLRDSAHIQTTENFANGKIASHNKKIDYQTRYDDWQGKFQHNDDGSVKTRPARYTGNPEAVLTKDAREYIDKGRPKGSASMHMDHVVPAAEIIRDPAAAAHMTQQEHYDYANSKVNLNEMDGAANESKGDARMTDWLESKRNGQTPAERFNIDEKDLRKKDEASRKEFEKRKTEAEKKSVEVGKQSQKEEAFRIGGEALKSIVMNLLANLVKTIFQHLVQWFRSANKSLTALLEYITNAVKDFFNNLKQHMISASNSLLTTIATAILGPIVKTIKKVWTLLKQGYKSIKDAIIFLKDPKNKNMPFSRKLLEIGKILIVGLTGIGTIVLGETIEVALMGTPLAIELPLFGSLAGILGIFFGGVVAGIIGAVALNIINKLIEKQEKKNNAIQQFNKKNEILAKQQLAIHVSEVQLQNTKEKTTETITERHQEAAQTIREASQNVIDNFKKTQRDEIVVAEDNNKKEFDDLFNALDNL